VRVAAILCLPSTCRLLDRPTSRSHPDALTSVGERRSSPTQEQSSVVESLPFGQVAKVLADFRTDDPPHWIVILTKGQMNSVGPTPEYLPNSLPSSALSTIKRDGRVDSPYKIVFVEGLQP
jgi:hypothetical protein